jgi:hypothetical protein
VNAGLRPISQRLIRKGALIEETYLLFGNWRDQFSLETNFDRVFHGNLRTDAWRREVRTTLRRRFRDIDAARALILLARANYPLENWRYCLLLWIASQELLYGDFATSWLFEEYHSGRLQLRTEDAIRYIKLAWGALNQDATSLSDYGTQRTARDLLRMARDLGVLKGSGSVKTFSPIHLSDELAVYCCQAIADLEHSTTRIVESPMWRVFLMEPSEVHSMLLRLHQFKLLRYEFAGSLVQIQLPCASAYEFAERMAA